MENKKTKSSPPKGGYYGSPEWQRNNEIIKKEINKNKIPPGLSFERFKKTKEEKEKVKKAKLKHKAELRRHGIDPKKQMNLTLDNIK